MRIIHTSDLHLGRQFNGLSLQDDHQAILDQIIGAITEHEVDVLIIAGDIFDRAAPPETAVRQFNSFLSRLKAETEAALVMIAGNHDSGARIAAMSIMTDTNRVLIRGAVEADEQPLILEDEHGPVAFSGLPFSPEYAARECFNDEAIHSPEDVLRAQIAAARQHITEGARWVIIAHAFVSGAMGSNSERPLARVGGIETVAPEVFAGAHYVALGHLHRPQSVTEPHIRYCGSPLAFGFDEADQAKSMNLVEIDGAGQLRVAAIAFEPMRGVRVLTGKHAELLLGEPSDDFVKAVLSDEVPVIDAMKRLRILFPNACDLAYGRDEQAPEIRPLTQRVNRAVDPIELIGDFLHYLRDERIQDPELPVITNALDDARDGQGAS